jgi:chemotaxis protein CheX
METTYDSHIEQIVQSIFTSMLGMEAFRGDLPADCRETVLGTVHIGGPKSASVVLGLTSEVARATAASMLQMNLEDVTSDDIRDVAAELTNMIGGNLKSLLPGPLFLSLPTVVAGRDLGLEIPGAELVEDVSLVCDAGPFRVRLYTQKSVG